MEHYLNPLWLFAIIPASVFCGMMITALCAMAKDDHPELDESHAKTRYDQQKQMEAERERNI